MVDPAKEFVPDTGHAAGALAVLRTTAAIRERAAALLARARGDQSEWFTVAGDDALEDTARTVVEVTRDRYAWRPIPYHSRWRHFEAGGIDRRARLDALLGDAISPAARARAHIDLALVSVLLDAGAGPHWRYVESASGQTFTRSEGLGVASFHAFTAGLFSSVPERPLQVDAAGLRGLVADRLGEAFQVADANPLVGLAGRTTLLRRLGEALAEQPEVFGPEGRPGGLFDFLASPRGPAQPAPTASVTAHAILSQLLISLSHIWPSGSSLQGGPGGDPALALGDCWRHRAVQGPGLTAGWMPFHKLSQWLTYSLIEPFEWAGVPVHGLDALTALPEYRNGGLLLDGGLLLPRAPELLQRRWQVGDEFIVEWRVLTIALLDELAPRVRHLMERDATEMPLACVLEGGTWAAGRVLAQRLRNGSPPLQIDSDGTVF